MSAGVAISSLASRVVRCIVGIGTGVERRYSATLPRSEGPVKAREAVPDSTAPRLRDAGGIPE